MTGMSRSTGRRLDPLAHINQSVHDICTTLIGTRLTRRSYGSLVPDLIDQPMNPATRLRLISSIATALIQWEQRVRVQKVSIIPTGVASGWIAELHLIRIDTPQPEPIVLALPLGAAA